MQSLTASDRAKIITHIANSLMDRSNEIIEANQKDLYQAQMEGITGPLYSRLIMNQDKLKSLASGLKQIANDSLENVGRVMRRTKVRNTTKNTSKNISIKFPN